VAFLDAEMDLWGVDFPSMTDSEKRGPGPCAAPVQQLQGPADVVQQSDLESDVYLVNEGIIRFCRKCGSSTIWKRATWDAAGETIPLENAPPEAEQRAEPV